MGLPEDASPRLPAAGPAVTPLPPCKQQAPWNPDGVLPSPVSWDFFCAKTTKNRQCYDMIRLTAKADGEPYFTLDF